MFPISADPSPVPSSSSTYHAIIGGIVAFIVFLLLILLIFLGHYLIRHKGQGTEGRGQTAGEEGRGERSVQDGQEGGGCWKVLQSAPRLLGVSEQEKKKCHQSH